MDTAQKKEPEDGRLVQYLLMNPANDGGQWDMLVNIVGKSPSVRELKPSFMKQGFVVQHRPFLWCLNRVELVPRRVYS